MRTSVVRAVVASLLACAVVTVVSLYQTPTYEASVKILVGPKTNLNPSISGLQDFMLTVAKAGPTMPIARAVVEELNLPKGSAREVLENMSVEQDPSEATNLINVSYEDSEPHL